MPQQINTAGPGSRLVKRFGLKGRFQPVLDEVIVPVVQVDETPASNLAMAGSNITVPAAAGEHAFLLFSNTVAQNVEIQIDGWFFYFTGTQILNLSWNLRPSLAASTLVASVESWRQGGLAGAPVGSIDVGSCPAASMPAVTVPVNAAQVHRERTGEFPLILQPGDEVTLWCAVANQALTRSMIFWQETPINVTDQ